MSTKRASRKSSVMLAVSLAAVLVGTEPNQASAQTNSIWTGTNGSWFDAANWDNGVPNGDFSAIIDSATDDAVVETGTSSNIVVQLLQVGTGDRLRIGNNSNFIIDELSATPSINNFGTIEIDSTANATDLRIEGNVVLDGGGTVILSGSNARILDEVGSVSGVLTNVDNTIAGEGQIGAGRTSFSNSGFIQANVLGGTLTLDPGLQGPEFTNTGTLQATNGGELLLSGSGGGRFLNAGGTIEAQTDSLVRLATNANLVGGNLQTTGSGRFVIGPTSSGILENLTTSGLFDVENSSDLELVGSVTNSGTIDVNSTGNATDIRIEGLVNLDGGGTVRLGGATNSSRILDETGALSGILNNVNNVIEGNGQIGFNRLAVVNGGTIEANVSGETLTLDPRNADDEFTNNGTLSASGGGELVLSGSGGGRFLNAGDIESDTGSTVRFTANGAVVGGNLQSTGTGRFVIGPNTQGTLQDVAFSGLFDVENNSDLELVGSVTNSGTIDVNSTGNATDIRIEGQVNLDGGGTVRLGGATNASRILDETGALSGILNNVDNVIEGNGQIGFNRLAVINGGTINANSAGQTLTLDPRNSDAEFTNNGTLRASDGGELVLSGGTGRFLNTAGLIDADDASTVRISGSTVVGGSLQSTAAGRFVVGPSASGVLEDVTFAGLFDVENNSNLELIGSISNSGIFDVSSTANATDIRIEGVVSLSGGGTIRLGGTGGVARILDETGALDGVLNNIDNVIEGHGQIGANRTLFNNLVGGTVTANVNGETLAVDTIGDTINAGIIVAEFGGTLSVADGLQNDGIGEVFENSFLDVGQSITNNGTLAGEGTIVADSVSSSGTIAPGHSSIGNLTIDSDLNLQTGSILDIELGAVDNDLLTVTGAISLDGDLTIDLLDLVSGTFPAATDVFTVATSSSLTGSFANVLNGGDLATLDGEGTFTVNFGASSAFDSSSVVLSNFRATAVPEPSSVAFLLMIGGTVVLRRRK